MKKVLFINASPTVGGNNDALIETAMRAALADGAECSYVKFREKAVGHCQACYGCAATGVCVQKDDYAEILALAHEAEGVVLAVPIYYNCMASQALTLIDRLCCTFACKNYKLGPKKKVAFMLTCTGSDVDEMTRHVRNITTLPSVARAITAERIEIFTGCGNDTCRTDAAYQERAKAVGTWLSE